MGIEPKTLTHQCHQKSTNMSPSVPLPIVPSHVTGVCGAGGVVGGAVGGLTGGIVGWAASNSTNRGAVTRNGALLGGTTGGVAGGVIGHCIMPGLGGILLGGSSGMCAGAGAGYKAAGIAYDADKKH